MAPARDLGAPDPPDGARHDAPPANPSDLPHPDAELAKRIRAGDVSAFEAVFMEHYAGLVTYLARTIRTNPHASADAEDLAQIIFVRLWERRAEFHPRTSLRSYLYGAARHSALNAFRDAKIATSALDPTDSAWLAPEWAEPSEDPLAELEHHDLTEALTAAIDRLPKRAREIWMLHRDHGLTYAEIASALGISANTVKTQLSRSLATLRRVAEPFLVVLLAIHR